MTAVEELRYALNKVIKDDGLVRGDCATYDALVMSHAEELDRLRLSSETGDRNAVLVALAEAIKLAVRLPDSQFAYSRCKLCDASWWDDREEHRSDCPVLRWKHVKNAAPQGSGSTETTASRVAPAAEAPFPQQEKRYCEYTDSAPSSTRQTSPLLNVQARGNVVYRGNSSTEPALFNCMSSGDALAAERILHAAGRVATPPSATLTLTVEEAEDAAKSIRQSMIPSSEMMIPRGWNVLLAKLDKMASADGSTNT